MRNRNNQKKGFTLLEIVVALGIFVLIALAAGWFLIHGFRYNDIIWEQLKTQNDGRRVLREVVDIVRKAEESSIGSYPIESAGEYELIIFANVDSDNYRERVRFWLENTTLKKGVIKPSGSPLSYSGEEQVVELAHNVINFTQSNPIFNYYNESYTGSEPALVQPVSVADVKIISVQLELEKDPSETPAPLNVESVVQIRNLKEN